MKHHNGKFEVVTFVVTSGRNMTIGVIFEKNVRKGDKGNFFCCFVFFYVKLMEPTMAKLELVIDIIDIPESEIKAFSFCILILSFS